MSYAADAATSHINPNHIADLEASGISIETAIANGIYSETDQNRVAAMLGWSQARRLGGVLVFPMCGIDGTHHYSRVKPDVPRVQARTKKPIKYESPKDATNRLYIPAEVRGLLKGEGELLITEGEKKALSATQHGFPCVGLVGVHGWKQKHRSQLIPCFNEINLKGRSVVIAFDSDIETKPQVLVAESWLAHHLQDSGATVRVVRFPDAADGSKQGVDDLLVSEGPGRLRELVDAATEPEPPDPSVVKESLASVPPEMVADEYLQTVRVGDTLTLRRWAGSYWRWSRGKYHELTDADVQADVVRRLRTNYSQLKRSDVANVMMNVASGCAVLSTAQPPRWLDGGDESARTWSARDTFCTKSHILHLPALVKNGPNSTFDATPKFFNTVAADYEYVSVADAPTRWLAFLNEVWPDDPDSIKLLQQWFGYQLTADTSQHKMVLVVGPKRSGKGTIARVLRSVVGDDNCCAPTLASLATNFGLSALLGKSVAIIGDARLSNRTDVAATTERLLSISGEDAQTVDRKHKDPITTRLMTRFTILSNELPRLNDASGALAGRMLVLRMTRSFYGQEDRRLFDSLLSERQSILHWAIAGWADLQQQGRFTVPSSSSDLAEQLEDIASPVSEFARERCEFGDHKDHREWLDDVYEEFRTWATSAGYQHVPTKVIFSRDLHAAFPTLRASRQMENGRRGRVVYGMRVAA